MPRLAQKYKSRQAPFVFLEMVLRDPGGIKAAVFGMTDLLDGQTIALCRIRLIEEPGEEAEAYWRYRCRHLTASSWSPDATA